MMWKRWTETLRKKGTGLTNEMAERVGFEPTVGV